MDDVNSFLTDFAKAWKSSQVSRILCYAFVAALIIAMLSSAFADVTRPRVYVVTPGSEKEVSNNA